MKIIDIKNEPELTGLFYYILQDRANRKTLAKG